MSLEQNLLERFEEVIIKNKDLQDRLKNAIFISNRNRESFEQEFREKLDLKQAFKDFRREMDDLIGEKNIEIRELELKLVTIDNVLNARTKQVEEQNEAIKHLKNKLKKGVRHLTDQQIVQISGWFRNRFESFSGDIYSDQAAQIGLDFTEFFNNYFAIGEEQE